MLDTKSRGQEAIEFMLITVLVFFAALFAVFTFGGKLAAFFQGGSSVSQISGASAPSLSNDSVLFKSDYETKVDLPNNIIIGSDISGVDGLVPIDINGVKVFIPSDISATIQTTGSSGGTDHIVSAIQALAAQLKSISEANPSDTNLQQMVTVASQLSDKGFLISDAEEWYEFAAQRLTSTSGLK
ncbi:MAG: hypothetical protein AB7V50_09310, partial [Vampirovibrionia bacterium]